MAPHNEIVSASLLQRVSPHYSTVQPYICSTTILGAIVAALDVIYELILVWVAGALRGRVLGSRRFAQWRRRVTGAVLIGLGARLALVQRQ